MKCSCGKKNCRCGGKKSSSKVGKYAEGGVVQPAQGQFSQGTQKYLNLIQQRRADARAQTGSRNPADVVNKYFPPPPPAEPAAPAEPAKPAAAAPQDSYRDRQELRALQGGPSGGGYTGIRDMFDGGGPGKPGTKFQGGPLSGTLNKIGVKPVGGGTSKPAKVAKDFSKPSGSNVGKPRGGR